MNLFICKAKIYDDIRTFGEGKYCGFKGQVRKNYVPQGSKEPCDFFDMVCFNEGRTKYITENFAKGSYLLITGEIQNTKTEKDGKTYYGNQVIINSVEKADVTASGSGSSEEASAPAKKATKSEPAPAEKDDDEFDDFGI